MRILFVVLFLLFNVAFSAYYAPDKKIIFNASDPIADDQSDYYIYCADSDVVFDTEGNENVFDYVNTKYVTMPYTTDPLEYNLPGLFVFEELHTYYCNVCSSDTNGNRSNFATAHGVPYLFNQAPPPVPSGVELQ